MRGVHVTALAAVMLFVACGRAKEGAKSVLNGGGELAGKAATEVVEGVTTGVESTWKVDVRLSQALRESGLALGVMQLESDSLGRNDRVAVYLTSKAAFLDTLRVVAFDKDSLEMGRARLPLDLKAGDGGFHMIQFPVRTDLGRKCRVVIDREQR